MQVGFRQFKGCFQDLDPLRGANVFVSTDQGTTWERRGCVQFPILRPQSLDGRRNPVGAIYRIRHPRRKIGQRNIQVEDVDLPSAGEGCGEAEWAMITGRATNSERRQS